MITVRDYSIWVSGTESRWADPEPVRILKWLTVAFRNKCPTGEETRHTWSTTTRFRQSCCAIMQELCVLEVDTWGVLFVLEG